MATIKNKIDAIEADTNHVSQSLILKSQDKRGITLTWLEKNASGTSDRKEKFYATDLNDETKFYEDRTVVNEFPIAENVIIKEFSTTTGSYRTKGYKFTATANQITNYDFSLPYDIEILAGEIWSKKSLDGDEIELIISPDTVVGVVTEAALIGTSTIKVSPTVIANLKNGRHVKFGTATDEYAVVTVNSDSIDISPALVSAVSVNDFVKMSIKMVETVTLYNDTNLRLGWTKIGSSAVPKNTTIRCTYNNKDTTNKEIYFYMDILY